MKLTIKVCLSGFFVLIVANLLNFSMSTAAYSEEYFYNSPGCIQALCNSAGDKLYVSYYNDNEIIEIDISTMSVIRSFSISNPGNIAFSVAEDYLFVLSPGPPDDKICKLRLSDGQIISSVALDGEIANFTLDENTEWLWAIHNTFPPIGYEASITDMIKTGIQDYPDSGFLTKISTNDMTIESTQTIIVFPMFVWYSQFNNNIYVLHETFTTLPTDPYDHDSHYTISVWDANTLQFVDSLSGAYHSQLFSFPSVGCEWSNDSRFFGAPNSAPNALEFSIRVIDTLDNSIATDFVILEPTSQWSLSVKFLQNSINDDYIWGVSEEGEPPHVFERTRTVIKINTQTQQFEKFIIPEANSRFGLFDVSPDGRTLYLTQPVEGSIIVTCPGNHAPVCNLLVVTPRPHTGPSPVAIEFDASGTYDDDGDTLTFHWDFDGDKVFDEPIDDAYTGDPSNPTHEYTADYEGAVNLRVTDNYQGECNIAVILSVDVQ